MNSDSMSKELFLRGCARIPGGVNSPVRSWRSVGGTPRFISKAAGAYIWDVDGNRFVDYVCSWGPMILGHAHPVIADAAKRAIDKGTSYGAPTEEEVIMAETIVEAVPSIEMVRFVNSGTEASMSAIRLARAYTGRSKIIKFEGGYHGHTDCLLVEGGSGLAEQTVASSEGVTAGTIADTITVPYNDAKSVKSSIERYENEVAAVIVEPIAGNMGIVPPAPGFLEELRSVTTAHGVLLIFDEVITGFRVGFSGAQGEYGVIPDITCLGKIIGGGFPVGAYGASKDIMQAVSPLGSMYQAGTLSGNPVAISAGLATLELLKEEGVYESLALKTDALVQGFREIFSEKEIHCKINTVRGAFSPFFTVEDVNNMHSASLADTGKFSDFFHKMINLNINPPPSSFEAWFVSLAHTDEDIAYTLDAARSALTK